MKRKEREEGTGKPTNAGWPRLSKIARRKYQTMTTHAWLLNLQNTMQSDPAMPTSRQRESAKLLPIKTGSWQATSCTDHGAGHPQARSLLHGPKLGIKVDGSKTSKRVATEKAKCHPNCTLNRCIADGRNLGEYNMFDAIHQPKETIQLLAPQNRAHHPREPDGGGGAKGGPISKINQKFQHRQY